MGKKKADNTGFRNGDLFCFNCGASYKMNLPQPLSMASAMMLQFSKDHSGCSKTWVEPIAETNGKTVEENADWWIANGERGISSETMFEVLSGRKISRYRRHPHDPDDFRRCYLLLQAVPQWKSELDKLRVLGDVWGRIVDNWDELTKMFEVAMKSKHQEAPEMYNLMKSIGC